MLFLLAVAAEGWSVVSACAAFATCVGAVKLGLETYEKVMDIREKRMNP